MFNVEVTTKELVRRSSKILTENIQLKKMIVRKDKLINYYKSKLEVVNEITKLPDIKED